jgi:lysophospholipase L1-like esterase
MIYCIGDSFTYGEELSNREQDAYPYVLSRMLDTTVTNLGKPATGNYRMVKRTMDIVLTHKPELIVIGWSDPARQEFADDISIVDLWAGRNYRNMQNSSDHRRDLIKYMTAYDVPGYYYTKWLRQIILLQSFCQANNVRCVMFNACNAEDWNRTYMAKHQDLVEHVDATTFVGWPLSGSTEWCFKTPHGPGGHPLEQGHQIIANKIYEHIGNLGWLS